MYFCTKFGKRLTKDARHCKSCGAPIKFDDVSAAARSEYNARNDHYEKSRRFFGLQNKVIRNHHERKFRKTPIIAGIILAVIMTSITGCATSAPKSNEHLNSSAASSSSGKSDSSATESSGKSDSSATESSGKSESSTAESSSYNDELDYMEAVYDFPPLTVYEENYDWDEILDRADSPECDMGDGSVYYVAESRIVYKNGDEFHGEWKDGLRKEGVYRFADGKIFEGEFYKGLPLVGKTLYADGSTFEGKWWKSGLPEGDGLLITADGKEYAGEWMEGLLGEVDDEDFKSQFIHKTDLYPAISAALAEMNGSSAPQTTPNNTDNNTNDKTNDKTNSKPVLVTEELSENPTAYTVTADSVYIQDPIDFFNGKLSYNKMGKSGNYNTRGFTGEASDYKIIEAYVNAVCDGNHNLKLVETYYEEINRDVFFSWGINYTGSGTVRSTTNVNYTDTDANIQIYGLTEKNKLKASVWIPKDMEQVDLGQRYGEENSQTGTKGKSATAGLYRLSDGSFRTDDNRLTVKPGEAVILRDGETYTTETAFNTDTKNGRDEFWARKFYKNETLFFCAPSGSLETNSIFTYKDLRMEQGWLNSSGSDALKDESDFTGYTWQLFFGACHDGDWITPLSGELNEFTDLFVRVMYYEPGNVAVLYIYSGFDSEPDEIEALCAFDLTAGSSSGNSDGEYTIYVGENLDITCRTEFDTTYELFKWEITEGASLAKLSGKTSETCKITAVKPGKVRLKVSYNYGHKEPDVLTDIPRTVDRTKEYEYIITIKNK